MYSVPYGKEMLVILAGYALGWGLPGIFTAMALALVVFGTTTATAVRLGAWR